MAEETYLPPVEATDGARTVFTAQAVSYVVGSLQVHYSGGLTTADGVTWAETPPNQVTFSSPPLATDTLILEYIET